MHTLSMELCCESVSWVTVTAYFYTVAGIAAMRLSLLVLSLLLCHSQTVVIRRSHNDTVYIGTQLSLTSHISTTGGVNEVVSVDITWTRGSDVIVNNSPTLVSVVSGSGSRYTSSLSFSPVTSSDGGPITATATVVTSFAHTVTASDTHILMVTGIQDVFNGFSNIALLMFQSPHQQWY